MTSAKPTTQAPPARTSPPPALPQASGHLLAVPKGAPFAQILGALAPKKLDGAAALASSNACKMQTTALPEAVRGSSGEGEKHGQKRAREDDLDPSMRQAAQLAPPMALAAREEQAQAAPLANARVSLEDLVPQLVKKIAWSGDAQRGTVRMELGAGELSGATLTVSAEHGRVSVRVDAPPGTDTSAWRERLASRLEARGLSVESVEVR